jgi:hypothetical protein
MKLDLRLTHRFLDQLWCQAVVAFLFKDKSLLTGYLTRFDEKLTGTLTQLIDTNFLSGRRHELILIASQQRVKADKVLFVGLGSPKSYSFDVLSAAIKKISSTLERLALYEFGIMVPWVKGIGIDYTELIKYTITNLIDYHSIHKRVSVHRFRPARPDYIGTGGVQCSGLGKKLKGDNGNPRKKCGFCHRIANAQPIFRLGVTKPGVSHLNTPSKWSLDTRIQPLNPEPLNP